MAFISRWLRRRSIKADESLHARGYDYAAGRLLRTSGTDKFDVVRQELLMLADNPFDRNAFDAGIECAVDSFDAIHPPE